MTPARARRTAVVVALAALTLAGCGTSRAGLASVVGTQTVSDSDVARMVEEVRVEIAPVATSPFDEKAVTRATVNRLTQHYVLAEAATREGIVITQTDVDKLIGDTATSNFGGDLSKLEQAVAASQLVPPSEIQSFARDSLIQQALANKLAPGGSAIQIENAVSAYLGPIGQQLGVEIAPRFGTWSFKASALDDVPNDLSFVPGDAAATAPSPAPSAS